MNTQLRKELEMFCGLGCDPSSDSPVPAEEDDDVVQVALYFDADGGGSGDGAEGLDFLYL